MAQDEQNRTVGTVELIRQMRENLDLIEVPKTRDENPHCMGRGEDNVPGCNCKLIHYLGGGY